MKNFDGYLKLKLGNDYVLLAGGGSTVDRGFTVHGSIKWPTGNKGGENEWTNYSAYQGIEILDSVGVNTGAPYLYATALHVGGYYWYQLAFERGNQTLKYRGGNDGGLTTSGWETIWSSLYQGSGTGLDADLLDGLHGSYYATVSSLSNYLPLSGGTLTNSEFYTLALAGGTQGKGMSLRYTDPSDSTKSYTGLILFRLSDWGMAIANYNASKAIGISSDGTPYYGWSSSKNTLLHSGNYTSYRHAYTNLTGSGTTANQAIVSSGTANGWTLKTLGSRAFDSTDYLPLAGGTMTGHIKWSDGHGNASNGWNVNSENRGIYLLNSSSNTTGAPYTYAFALHAGGVYWFDISFERGGNLMYWRAGNYDSTWGWYKFWDTSNFNPNNYVLKSGDDMSGSLRFTGAAAMYHYNSDKSILYSYFGHDTNGYTHMYNARSGLFVKLLDSGGCSINTSITASGNITATNSYGKFGGNHLQYPIRITRAYNDSVDFLIGSAAENSLNMRISNNGSAGGAEVYIDLLSGGGGVNVSPSLKVGGVAVSLNGHTHDYLPLSGGTLNKTVPTIANTNATPGDSNAWNNSSTYLLGIVSYNNIMTFQVGGGFNERVALILVGHNETERYANVTGILHLNKLGGDVYINNYLAIHRGNISPELLIDGNTIASKVGGITSSYITVPYATNSNYSNNSGQLGGYNSDRYYLDGRNFSYDSDSALWKVGSFGIGGANCTTHPFPSTYGAYINFSGEILYRPLMYMEYNASRLWFRSRIWDETVTGWHEVAFVDTKVNSATLADNADTVDNKHASDFATAGHNHDDKYVTALGISSDYVTWTKNGTTNSLTVPYAIRTTKLIPDYSLNVNTCSENLAMRLYYNLNNNNGYAGADNSYGFPCGNNANGILWVPVHSGSYGGQFGISSNSYLYYRYISGGSFPTTANGGSWNRIAYYSEIPTTMAWSLITSKPDTATRWPKWSEITDKTTSKTIYGNTYIDSSGNFQNVSGWIADCITGDYSFPGYGANKGIRVVSNAGSAGTASPSSYMVGINISAYYGLSIATYGGGDSTNLWWRNNNGTWREILHAGNWSSYCAAASHTHSYLPLSGGTLNRSMHSVHTLNTTNGSADAWNNPDNALLRLESGDNLMILSIGNPSNERHGIILVGHNSWGSYAYVVSNLSLNPLGGSVGIGKTTGIGYTLDVNGNCGATNFYTTSDRSKKQNISPFSEHIRKFQLKDTEKWHYGVIALELEEMFRDGEEGNMTVNYNSVLSYYIGLLENKVKDLEEKVRQLENINKYGYL